MKRVTRSTNQNGNKGDDSDDTASSSDKDQQCLNLKRCIDKFNTPSKKATFLKPILSKTPSRFQQVRTPKVTNTPSATSAQSQLKIAKNFNSDPVEVYCRLRPLDPPEGENLINIKDDKNLSLVSPEQLGPNQKAKEIFYSFEKVYSELTPQKTVFDQVSLPLIEDLLGGKSGLLFAFGVTGSGKTYTMSGTRDDPGIMPRAVDVIFNSISAHKAPKYCFKPDRMNGFETQSKVDALAERQREMTKTPRTLRKNDVYGSRQQLGPGELDLDPQNRHRDTSAVTLPNPDSLYAVFITYIEIYNNFVYDLLDESPIEIHKKGLQSKILREDGSHNIYVNGVTEVEVESAGEALEVYMRGQRRRRMAHTALNTESSRSHSIFNIRLVQAPLDSEGEEIVEDKSLMSVSQLSLVDLAGSERYGRTGAVGDRLKEAGNINSSLMTLRRCMEILRSNQKSSSTEDLVPYRNTKLTHFLKSYFEGAGRVRMILCINPRAQDYEENIHVLNFAEITREVQITRPSTARLDPGTPGRRKANEMYKEAKKMLVREKIISEDELPVSDVAMVFNLGPQLPLYKMTRPEEGELLTRLRKALENRIKGRAALHQAILEKRTDFRNILVDFERNNDSLKAENTCLVQKITQLQEDKESMESAMRTLQFERAEIDIKYEELERANQSLLEQIDEYKKKMKEQNMVHKEERRRITSDLEIQRELDEIKRERQMAKEEEKLKAEYKSKDKAIAAVKELVSQLEVNTTRVSRSRSSRGVGRNENVNSLSSASSDSDINFTVLKSPNRFTRSRVSSEPRLPLSSSPIQPPPNTEVSDMAVVNRRRSRSQSTSKDTWLEHAPPLTLMSNQTVFQPVMKKKKSVSKLTRTEDITSAASKYCLRTNVQTNEGDVETQLYKGDVLQTVSGGAQVIFNDVEILRQVSPSSVERARKRGSSRQSGTATTNGELDAGEISARCATGIGNTVADGGLMKRFKHQSPTS